MPLIELFKSFRDKYMRSAVEKMEFTEFWLIAQKLGLTGFAENLPNGDVRMQIQGPENKIFHLISCMESIRRIQIENKKIDEMALIEETEFTPIY